jgi:hypothetical protein
MHHHKRSTNKIKDLYYKIKNKIIPKSARKYLKFIPILGLIILFALSYGINENELDVNQVGEKLSAKEKFLNVLGDIQDSFIFSDLLDLFFTIVLLITIWTGYKYWFTKWKYTRKNSRLLEKLVIVSMVVIFIFRHVKVDSFIGGYVDWALFLLFLYLVVVGTWFLAKTIDRIDLSSDLYCWGLRLLGGIVAFFGFMLLMSSTFAITFTNSQLILNNIYWIASICIILLGAFMGYRSFRRHPAIHVW